MKRVISCVLLMLVLTSNAFALEVPTDTVVQNLNGSQQAIKTFTVSPEQDPAALIEEPFELEGYLYTFADIVKSENPVEEKRIHTEVITVETTKDDLALILEQLKPTIEYDDGRFQGTLALDHTSLNMAGSISRSIRCCPIAGIKAQTGSAIPFGGCWTAMRRVERNCRFLSGPC